MKHLFTVYLLLSGVMTAQAVGPGGYSDSESEFESAGYFFRIMDYNDRTVEIAGVDRAGGKYSTKLPSTVTHDDIEYTVVRIGDHALENYYKEYITIPGTVQSIGRSAFRGVTMEEFVFENPEAEIIFEPEAFSHFYMYSDSPLRIPGGVHAIADSCFMDCRIGQLILPASVNSIGKHAFADGWVMGNIQVEAAEPPAIEGDAFEKSVISEIYTSDEAAEAYKNHPVWGKQQIKGSFPTLCNGLYFKLDKSNYTAVLVNHPRLGGGMRYAYDIDRVPSQIEVDGSSFTVTTIGGGALAQTMNKPLLTIPSSVVLIGSRVLSDASYSQVIFESDSENEEMTLQAAAFGGCPLQKITLPENVKKLPVQLFINDFFLNEVTLPSGLVEVGDEAFLGCESLITLTVNATVPPLASESSFDPEIFSQCTLNVPAGTVAAYASADVWNRFMKITDGTTAIETVSTTPESNEAVYYNLQGVRINTPEAVPGLYIMHKSGKTVKILVK